METVASDVRSVFVAWIATLRTNKMSFEKIFRGVAVAVLLACVVFRAAVSAALGYDSRIYTPEFKLIAAIIAEVAVTKLPPSSKQARIYVCNHFSFIEFFVLNVLVPDNYTVIRSDLFVPKVNAYNVPLPLKILQLAIERCHKQLGLILYDKYDTGIGNKGEGVVGEINAVIARGFDLVIFPEGRSQKLLAPPMEFRSQIFDIAKELDVEIVSSAVRYDRNVGVNQSICLGEILSHPPSCHMTFEEPQKHLTQEDAHALVTDAYNTLENEPRIRAESNETVRHALKSLVCVMDFVVIPLALAIGQAIYWEKRLLQVQLFMYATDMFYVFYLNDKMQCVHHVIGAALVRLRMASAPSYAASCAVLSIIFTEQALLFVHTFCTIFGKYQRVA